MNAVAPKLTVSVLMSTYSGETGSNLNESLASMLDQTLLPDQIVLVVDGPVSSDQERVIEHFVSLTRAHSNGVVFDLVRRSSRGGLAIAMNDGLERCTGQYVMRMDSDDVAVRERLSLQIAYATGRPDIDVVSSWSEEFFEDGAASQLKVSPCDHEHVVRALRWRNVLVHPTVLIRASTLRRVGAYRAEFGKLEDYDLFVRLVMASAKFHVIPKALVRVRSSILQRGRRGGWSYVIGEIKFRIWCLRSGFMSLREFIVVTCLYIGFRLVSATARRRLYSLARS